MTTYIAKGLYCGAIFKDRSVLTITLMHLDAVDAECTADATKRFLENLKSRRTCSVITFADEEVETVEASAHVFTRHSHDIVTIVLYL